MGVLTLVPVLSTAGVEDSYAPTVFGVSFLLGDQYVVIQANMTGVPFVAQVRAYCSVILEEGSLQLLSSTGPFIMSAIESGPDYFLYGLNLSMVSVLPETYHVSLEYTIEAQGPMGVWGEPRHEMGTMSRVTSSSTMFVVPVMGLSIAIVAVGLVALVALRPWKGRKQA